MNNKNSAAIGGESGSKSEKTADTVDKKKERVNKDFVIRARVTAEERELFEKKAAERGFDSVSEMIRSLIAEDDNADNAE